MNSGLGGRDVKTFWPLDRQDKVAKMTNTLLTPAERRQIGILQKHSLLAVLDQ